MDAIIVNSEGAWKTLGATFKTRTFILYLDRNPLTLLNTIHMNISISDHSSYFSTYWKQKTDLGAIMSIVHRHDLIPYAQQKRVMTISSYRFWTKQCYLMGKRSLRGSWKHTFLSLNGPHIPNDVNGRSLKRELTIWAQFPWAMSWRGIKSQYKVFYKYFSLLLGLLIQISKVSK